MTRRSHSSGRWGRGLRAASRPGSVRALWPLRESTALTPPREAVGGPPGSSGCCCSSWSWRSLRISHDVTSSSLPGCPLGSGRGVVVAI